MTKRPVNETPARHAFSQRMKAAGWKRLPAGGFGWIHCESGTTWEGENYTADQGIAWEWYHERGETPPTGGGACDHQQTRRTYETAARFIR